MSEPNLPEIIRRYLGGESVQSICVDVTVTGGEKVTRRTIYNWMLGGLGDEQYRELVTRCLVGRVADADDMLEDAKDVFGVQKAREIARFARMDLERRRPALYGPKQEVNHRGNAPTFMVVMAGPEGGVGRVIEGTPVSSALPAPVGAGVAVVEGECDGVQQG